MSGCDFAGRGEASLFDEKSRREILTRPEFKGTLTRALAELHEATAALGRAFWDALPRWFKRTLVAILELLRVIQMIGWGRSDPT